MSFPVDQEHGGLRVVVAITFVAATILSYIVLSALIPASFVNLLAVLGALVLGSVLTYLIEQQLKARWPSGKMLNLATDEITVTQNDKQIRSLSLSDDAQVLLWHFVIDRRTRVPKGWHMAAAAVQVGDEVMAAYTLIAPDGFNTLNQAGHFTKLEKVSAGTTTEEMKLAGKQRRLHNAENLRWQDGVEMAPDDFGRYVDELQRRLAP